MLPMLDLNIRDLIDLMETECKNVEDRIQKMYQWDFNRTKLICRLCRKPQPQQAEKKFP
jgi:hypothetical protein